MLSEHDRYALLSLPENPSELVEQQLEVWKKKKEIDFGFKILCIFIQMIIAVGYYFKTLKASRVLLLVLKRHLVPFFR